MKSILMTPDNIKATTDGRKTQTRRIESGLKEINKESDAWESTGWAGSWGGYAFEHNPRTVETVICRPRYHSGETVHLKEAWASMLIFDNLPPNKLDTNTPIWFKDTPPDEPTNCGDDMGKWRSPMFLRAKDARYFLKIISVRPERLQEISEQDAIAEGVGAGFQMNSGYPDYQHITNGVCELTQDTAVASYMTLWDSINGKDSHKNNEWVWVYTYQLTERPTVTPILDESGFGSGMGVSK